MVEERSIRIDAPEGKMLVSRKLKAIGLIVRTSIDSQADWEVLDESKAKALDKEWHPEFYGLSPMPDPNPVPPSESGSTATPPAEGSGADFVDKVHDKLTEGR